jgi:NADPH:quinone reductase-like Zn-dependent oxidoreductase
VPPGTGRGRPVSPDPDSVDQREDTDYRLGSNRVHRASVKVSDSQYEPGEDAVQLSRGQRWFVQQAQAFWVTGPGRGEIRSTSLSDPGADEVLVQTRWSAVSRGTELIVFAGRVPPDQWQEMRAPFQDGDFPAPVKYGYLNVGVVRAGPPELLGRNVFCLYPHQTAYVVPAAAVLPVPEGVPGERAVLAGTVETAINALWDAAPRIGDRACVVGAGMVGCCVARLLARIPGTRVTLVDVEPARAQIAASLGVAFAHPDEVSGEHEVVVHASATAEGLRRCLDLLAPGGTVTELSWYGSGEVSVPLGGGFHSRRLGIKASQVGAVAAARRDTRSSRDRLALALELLRDPAYDCLLDGVSDFAELPALMPELVGRPGLCHVIRYGKR